MTLLRFPIIRSRARTVDYIDPSGEAFFDRATIDATLKTFQETATQCLGKIAASELVEQGLYLLIADVMTEVVAGQGSNIYVGRTGRNCSVRFAEHKGAGKVWFDTEKILLPDSIVNDRQKFATLEQLLLDLFGGKGATANKINATRKVFCE